jgi:hypothetical protein
MCVMSMIVFFPKQQLLLRTLPWMMHIVSYLKMSDNLFLYVCSTFQKHCCDGILKNIELQCAHSHLGTKANGYSNHQWYVHTMKNVQLQNVTSQGEYIML